MRRFVGEEHQQRQKRQSECESESERSQMATHTVNQTELYYRQQVAS
jgi:hypothetical protein